MTMAQIWPLVAAMITVFAAMIGLVLRSMASQRAELSAKIDGTHEKINGLRESTSEKIDGLRNEMNARFEPLSRLIGSLEKRFDKLDDKVDRIDQDVRDLRKEAFADSRPRPT